MSKITYEVSREEFLEIMGITLTEEQWVVVKTELEDALDYYFWEEVPRILNDLDEMMKEEDA